MNLPVYEPKSTLLEQMSVSPRWRRNGLPADPGKVIAFAHADKIETACREMLDYAPKCELVGFHAHKWLGSDLSFPYMGRDYQIPFLPSDCLSRHPECAGVLYWQGCVAPDLLYHLETAIRSGTDIIIFPRVPIGEAGRRFDPDLYKRKGPELETIYRNLEDYESRLAFASVIKGLLRGDIEWPRPPVVSEYAHPFARPEKNDIVIDAGLFDSSVLRKFALAVGSAGHVYGFEPEPSNHAFVLETLKRFGDPGNITVVQKGLWSHKDTLKISAEGASGSLCIGGMDNSSLCAVTDLDSFVAEQGINKIDLIKMDIEGAELEALKGAACVIARFRPKLQICAYHKIDDLTEIPALITQIAPDYVFNFCAHAPYLNEYVYYAKPVEKH